MIGTPFHPGSFASSRHFIAGYQPRNANSSAASLSAHSISASALTASHAPSASFCPPSANTGISMSPASAGPTNVAAGITPPIISIAVASATIMPLTAICRVRFRIKPPPSRHPFDAPGAVSCF